MEEITHNEVPKAVSQILCRVMHIEHFLLEQGKKDHNDENELLTVQDAAKFLRLSVPTVYGLIHRGELPVMKRSKRCYFYKSELLKYLQQGRKKTKAEITQEASSYFKTK